MADEPSLDSSPSMTEIERKVQELEEMFKDRYTENDEDYMKTVSTPLPDPPCIKNWFVRQQRGNWNRGGGGGGYRGSGDRRYDDRNRGNYHGNRDSGDRRYDDRNRDNYHGNRDSGDRRYDDRNRDNYYGNRGQDHHSHRGGRHQRNDNYGNRGRHDQRYNPY
ncbi:RNMT-activating mini protein [Mytilus galloprovincialis]|uniref:RNMT-activating mini protein n=1 Tax=Mytilus galloprovincialis TaxID=29158 RepID=A0A8B6BYP4_MYTGA|nr:RNMT-activating mini protein [Mytilus galloprovincialis]